MKLSTITCTHNPRVDVLHSVLDALLAQQGIAPESFEILVVDNRSTTGVAEILDDRFADRVRVVREDKLGLTPARLRGLAETSGDIIVFVDDDNVLSPNYLADVLRHFTERPELGSLGGRALPVFAVEPPPWFSIERYSLGCRDLGETPLKASWHGLAPEDREYPICAPIGGGMGIRRDALQHYADSIASDSTRKALDRTGASLASGGDNDIVMCTLDMGYEVAYQPELSLQHVIPAGRVSLEYLERYQRDTMRTWVQVLDAHGIRPWTPISPATLPLRKLRAYLRQRAWQSPQRRLAWKAACGLFEGRAALSSAAPSVAR